MQSMDTVGILVTVLMLVAMVISVSSIRCSRFKAHIPYSGKFPNGANFRIIRKLAICAKIKIFEILFWPRTRMQVGRA